MPFKDVQLDDVVNPHETFISPVHASRTFVIPPQSEILVPGRLDDLPASVVSINGMLAPRTNLCHRYCVFGASEFVSVADDGTVAVRIVNPSSQPVKIYRRTRNLFKKYRDVFAFPGDQLGRTSLVQHVIDTGDAMPIKQRPYRASPYVKKEIDRQVDEVLENGIIQESVSPWSTPVVLVKKKDGSYRLCVDFRKLNKATKLYSFPMPFESLFLSGFKKWFLANSNAFWLKGKNSFRHTKWSL